MSRTISERVVALAAQQAGKELSDVTPESRLVADLGFDSIDQVEFLMLVEDEFGLEIPDEDCDAILSVNDVVAYVTKRKSPEL